MVPWGLWIGILVHFAWAVLILIGPADAKPVTALHHMSELLPNHLVRASALLLVSGLALYGVLMGRRRITTCGVSWEPGFWVLLPQQCILIMSATGSVVAICQKKFPDGYPSPGLFIAEDQVSNIVIALLHTLNIVELHLPRIWVKFGGRK